MKSFGRWSVCAVALVLLLFVGRCGSTRPAVVPGPSASPTATPQAATAGKRSSSAAAAVAPVTAAPCPVQSVQTNFGWPGIGPGQIPPAGSTALSAPQSVIFHCVSTGERMTVKLGAGARLDIATAWPAVFVPDAVAPPPTPTPAAGPVYVSNFHAGDAVQVAGGPYLRSGPAYSFAVVATAPDGLVRIAEDCRMDPGGVRPFCHLVYPSGLEGWASDEPQYLTLSAAAPQTPRPTATPTAVPTVVPTVTPTLTLQQIVADHERRLRILEGR